MCALVPSFFPNFGWPSTNQYESYYGAGDNLNNGTFLELTVPQTYEVTHHQNSLGVSVSSEGNEIDNNPVVVKKLNHNASERDRRKKINTLFSSLRSCLPASDQSVRSLVATLICHLHLFLISSSIQLYNSKEEHPVNPYFFFFTFLQKKLSIPETVSKSLKYIPELQQQVKRLIQKKEEILVRVSGQRDFELYDKQQPKAVASYLSTVSATRLGDNEVMVQVSSSKIHNFSISNVLGGIEEDGFVLVDVSSSRSQGERLFYTLHLQVENMDDYKINCEELSERMLYLYEKCENSFN